ncbi:hypothetical protein F5887DRAFT_1169631 [Amanita rubescens]|nr:hypothetical protein F5887DRAFT_1169631 [Amanita rubescens]
MADITHPLTITPDVEVEVAMRRKQYKCQHFRILIIGRANAGKTTILEKVCGVAKGTKPIICDEDNKKLDPDETHLAPSIERGMHDIKHQITYKGSNFIFHDSQGFESGAREELEAAWDFIEKRSVAANLTDQLHAIWYCIPMDSARPILSSELEFFDKGTGNVPLVAVFTKFDGQIVQQSETLNHIENDTVKWDMARKNAEITFETTYLHKVLNTPYPPKAYVKLEDMDMPENDCPELTEKTADAIDDISLQGLFISTQMNNLGLCVKAGLKHVLRFKESSLDEIFIIIFSKFPHYWIDKKQNDEIDWASDITEIFINFHELE